MRCNQIRAAWGNWVETLDFDYALTFNFNWETNANGAKKRISRWLHEVDRAILGRKFDREHRQQRSQLIGVFEHESSNFHVHAFFRIARGSKSLSNADLDRIWRNIVPGGSLWFKLPEDPKGWFDYSTKDFRSKSDFDRVFISSMFHSATDEH